MSGSEHHTEHHVEHHGLRHGLDLTGEIYRDALLSIFTGPPHHDEWEAALERWDSQAHPFPSTRPDQ